MATRELPRFGDLVRRHRTAAALSQEALAARAGLSVRGVSDLERGVHRAPRLETVRLLADALALGAGDRGDLLAAARPRVAAAPSPAHGRAPSPAMLPLPPTRLIGRDTEVARICGLLARDDARLVTLTGAGGTGKTRLAQAVAAVAREQYPDGVFFVDLSPLTDPALVVVTIAAALAVREIVGESLRETLSRHLRERRLLLVLDNCEQVLAAAPDIAALLATCSNLVILATSRVPLHIRAEREVSVAPLTLPDPDRLPPLADLAGVAAVTLFVERTRAVSADFALTGDNAATIAAICRRLDGLPLAIELAAARAKVLPPQALLTRLEQRLPLLTGGRRDLPARQQTMRAAIAWSYDLLHKEEQGLFQRLSVFAGGFTLEAAEAVTGQDGTRDVFTNIAALVDGSLLRQLEDRLGEPRFRMLETVREYGLEQLAQVGETDDARQRHADYFLKFIDSQADGDPVFVGMERLQSVAREHDNLRLALTWLDERDETDALLRVSTALYGVWLPRSHYSEGHRWLERGLERSSRVASVPRVQALTAASKLATFQGDYARAAELVAEGLTLARELGDPFLIAQALSIAGFLSYRRGEYDRAEEQLGEALRLLRDLGDRLPDMGPETYFSLQILGDASLAQEQFDGASRRFAEAIEVVRAVGAVWRSVDARAGLAGVHYCTGNRVQAATLYADCLVQARDLGIVLLVASSLLGLAGVAAASGRPAEGARLLGAAEGIASSLGAPIFPRDRPIRKRALAAMTAVLGEERLAASREAGRALTVEEAIAEATIVAEAVVQLPA